MNNAPLGLSLHEGRVVLRGDSGTPQVTPRVWRALMCVIAAYPIAVSYEDIDAAIWPDRPAAWKRTPPRSPVIFDLRAVLATIGLDLVRRGKGYALEEAKVIKAEVPRADCPAPVTLPRVMWLERPMPSAGSYLEGNRQ